MKTNSPQIIAHRGSSGNAPENTLSAFRLALEAGAKGIEIDVHLSKDKKVVVIHDFRIDRTTGNKGLVSEITFAELRKCNASKGFEDAFPDEKIPSLEEVLNLTKGKAILYIELKKGRTFYPGLEERVLQCIYSQKAEGWCVLHSFHPAILFRINRSDKKIPLLLTAENYSVLQKNPDAFFKRPLMKLSNMAGLNLNSARLSAGLLKKIHSHGMKLYSWTVNNTNEMRRMKRIGADGIITNFPSRAAKLFS